MREKQKRAPFQSALLAGCLAGLFGCATTEAVPIQAGDWRLGADASAAISDSDLNDATRFLGAVSGGVFIVPPLLLEGTVSVSTLSSTQRTNPIAESAVDSSDVRLALGLRYFLRTQGSVRPYVGVQGGVRYRDLEVETPGFSGINDTDTNEMLQVRAGVDVLINRYVGIDYGLLFTRDFGVNNNGTDEDLNTIAALVGISIWL